MARPAHARCSAARPGSRPARVRAVHAGRRCCRRSARAPDSVIGHAGACGDAADAVVRPSNVRAIAPTLGIEAVQGRAFGPDAVVVRAETLGADVARARAEHANPRSVLPHDPPTGCGAVNSKDARAASPGGVTVDADSANTIFRSLNPNVTGGSVLDRESAACRYSAVPPEDVDDGVELTAPLVVLHDDGGRAVETQDARVPALGFGR